MKTPSSALKKHQRFIHFLRWLFPVIAMGVLLTLLIYPQIIKQKDFINTLLKTDKFSFSANASVDMTKVQFMSEDKKGQPFTIHSEKVLEVDAQKSLVQLDNPEGEITLSSGEKVFIKSPVGFFYQKQEIVHFTEDIQGKTDSGYIAFLKNVVIEHKKQFAYSRQQVSVSGPAGSLDSNGFEMRKNGEEIDFQGSSKLILKQENTEQIDITSKDGIQVRQIPQTLTAKGDVEIIKGDNKIYGETAIAYLKKFGNKYAIKSFQADTDVKIVTPTETITGDHLLYNVDNETAQITGNVKIEKKEGHLQGDKATVDMKTGISKMQMLPSKDGELGTPARIKGVFYPTQFKDKKE